MEDSIMVRRIQDGQSARFRPRLSWVPLGIVLLAGVSQTFAQDEVREHARNEREDREKDGRAHRPGWPMIGHDPTNTRDQPFERRIGPENAMFLAPKWVATIAGDVSATPAVVDGAVYFGDFGGMLWKLNAETGEVIWSHLVSDYTGIAGDVARSRRSPFQRQATRVLRPNPSLEWLIASVPGVVADHPPVAVMSLAIAILLFVLFILRALSRIALRRCP